MKFLVKWGSLPNTSDGCYDIKETLEQIEICATENCREWEEAMWDSIHIGDFLVELLKGRSVNIPYQGDSELPDVLTITPLKEVE